jgi:hypothetical protein
VEPPRPHSMQGKCKQLIFNRRPSKEEFFGQAMNGASRSWFCQSMACASRSRIVRRLVFYQCTALLCAAAPCTVNEPGTARAISALPASIPTRFVIGFGQHCFRAPRPCLSATSALTLRSRGRPKGCAFCPPLTSNVRRRIRAREEGVTSWLRHRFLAQKRRVPSSRSRWRKHGTPCVVFQIGVVSVFV